MDEFISLTGTHENYLIKKSAIVSVSGDKEGYGESIVTVNVGSEKSVYFVKDTIKKIQEKLEGFEGYGINN